MAEIQNPAAIFSAEGLKLFIEAIKGNDNKIAQAVTGPVMADVNFDDEVDSLVKEYREHTAESREDKQKRLDVVANLVEQFILWEDRETIPGRDIRNYLETQGYEYKAQNINAMMRTVMTRKPHIQNVGNGFYSICTEVNGNE